MVIGESRSELLQWLNSAFGLEYTKVEQCGTGAAYCQIMDSIYGGVAMGKVKFGANIPDYDARNNMKVLQAAFNRHGITRQIETERLIKCRLQDNLELLQWLKRHWMENKDVNVPYDASARRRLGATPVLGERTSASASRRTTLAGSSGTSTPRAGSKSGSRVASTGSVSAGGNNALFVPKQRVASGPGSRSGSVSLTPGLPRPLATESRALSVDVARALATVTRELKQVREENGECKIMMDSLETERNFYFNKLRDIEILTKKIQEEYTRTGPAAAAGPIQQLSILDIMGEIQEILYSTEKGFEIQDTADAESF